MSDWSADKEREHQRRLQEYKHQREEEKRERVKRLSREYGHLSREELNQKIAEEEKLAIQNSPGVVALRRWGEERRQAEQAAAEQRRRQAAEQREAAAQAELAAEKERQRRIWISSGNPESTFEENWIWIEQEVLMERRRAFEERVRHDSVF